MNTATLRLPSPPPDDPKTDQNTRQRQAGPKSAGLRYSDIWRCSNGLAPAGTIETPCTRSAGAQASVPVTAVWRQRAAARLHDLGPRPVLEALIAVAAGGDLDDVLADFARLDPDIVHALRGDAFPRNVFAVAGR